MTKTKCSSKNQVPSVMKALEKYLRIVLGISFLMNKLIRVVKNILVSLLINFNKLAGISWSITAGIKSSV